LRNYGFAAALVQEFKALLNDPNLVVLHVHVRYMRTRHLANLVHLVKE